MHALVDIIINFASSMWYVWIFIMMVIESSFVPFPSEVAMVPAWYLSSIWEMNFIIALLIWTLWALFWAMINYAIWYFMWWKKIIFLINKFWKYFFIKESHYHISENYFKKHGMITAFLARFIPAVRQLISLPAWTFKINLPLFLFFTWLGAGIWNLILLYIWYIAWKNKELVEEYSHTALIFVLVGVIIIWVVYYYTHKYFQKKYAGK